MASSAGGAAQEETTTMLPQRSPGISQRSRCFSDHTLQLVRAWAKEHIHHPFPSRTERQKLAREGQVDEKQITNWFNNFRRRYWKPHLLKKKQQQQERLPKTKAQKQHQPSGSPSASTAPATAATTIVTAKDIFIDEDEDEEDAAFPEKDEVDQEFLAFCKMIAAKYSLSHLKQVVFRTLALKGLPMDRKELFDAIRSKAWSYFLTILSQMRAAGVLKPKSVKYASTEMIELADECNPHKVNVKIMRHTKPAQQTQTHPPSKTRHTTNSIRKPATRKLPSSSSDDLFHQSLLDGIRLADHCVPTDPLFNNTTAWPNSSHSEWQSFSNTKIEELLQQQRQEIIHNTSTTSPPKFDIARRKPINHVPINKSQFPINQSNTATIAQREHFAQFPITLINQLPINQLRLPDPHLQQYLNSRQHFHHSQQNRLLQHSLQSHFQPPSSPNFHNRQGE